MQTIDNKLYPFDKKIYADNLSQYPNDVKIYQNPPQPNLSNENKFNICNTKNIIELTTEKLNTDSQCVCNNKTKIVKILEGQSYYFCK
jgi:hypothetical protein